MIEVYTTLIIEGRRDIESVPSSLRSAVEHALKQFRLEAEVAEAKELAYEKQLEEQLTEHKEAISEGTGKADANIQAESESLKANALELS
jgi:hypothetical protein